MLFPAPVLFERIDGTEASDIVFNVYTIDDADNRGIHGREFVINSLAGTTSPHHDNALGHSGSYRINSYERLTLRLFAFDVQRLDDLYLSAHQSLPS